MVTEQLFIKDIERYPSHLTINNNFTKDPIHAAIITLFNLDFNSKDAHILNELRNKSNDTIRSLDKTDINTIFLYFYVDNKKDR